MKNIYEILKSIGVEVPDDKKESLDKSLAENYKTIKEVEGLNAKLSKAEGERDTYKKKYDEDIATRDNDLADLKKKLEDAGADKATLEQLNTQLSELQSNYNNAKTDYEKKLSAQRYEFAIKELANELKFTSNSAKKAFLNDAIAKNMPMENDKILGFTDFVNAYKEQDAGAFVVDDNNSSQSESKPKPQFAGKSNPIGNDGQQSEQSNNTDTPSTSSRSVIW